jgi:hypothetical protein
MSRTGLARNVAQHLEPATNVADTDNGKSQMPKGVTRILSRCCGGRKRKEPLMRLRRRSGRRGYSRLVLDGSGRPSEATHLGNFWLERGSYAATNLVGCSEGGVRVEEALDLHA